MRKLISILVTLGVVLGMTLMAAVPVAAVDAPVEVDVDNPLAGELSDYLIVFHNGSNLLLGDGDFFDVMFPAGTSIATIGPVFIDTGATKAAAVGAAGTTAAGAIIPVGTTALRLDVAADIVKCDWVAIVVTNVTNPSSCFHHLQVGSSTHTPVASEDYTIYSMKMDLVLGKNLISLPDYPEDDAIEVVLAGLFAKLALDPTFEFSVWYWDASTHTWVKYVSDTSFDDLTTIEPGKAYWIKVSEGVTFYYKGVPYPDDQGPPEKFCWYVRSFNMVGFSSLTAMNWTRYLDYTLVPPAYDQYAVFVIYGWNSTTQQYYDLGCPWVDAALTPGEGYWMAFSEAACIIPPLQ